MNIGKSKNKKLKIVKLLNKLVGETILSLHQISLYLFKLFIIPIWERVI